MRRRDFVLDFSGAVALAMLHIASAQPRTQQVARVWRVGLVAVQPRDKVQHLLDAFSSSASSKGAILI
jgi:hypothetical protein